MQVNVLHRNREICRCFALKYRNREMCRLMFCIEIDKKHIYWKCSLSVLAGMTALCDGTLKPQVIEILIIGRPEYLCEMAIQPH